MLISIALSFMYLLDLPNEDPDAFMYEVKYEK